MSPQQKASADKVLKSKRFRIGGKHIVVMASLDNSNIIPSQLGQRGLNIPLLPANELNVPVEGVQHDIIQGVADQIFGTGCRLSGA